MHVALVCVALLGLLLFGLGLAVSLKRGATNTVLGHSPDPADALHKLVRAHANTAEFAPFLGVLMLAVGAREPAAWALWCMGLATAGRYLLVAGLLLSPTLAKPHPLRFAGALTTYLTGLALSIALLLSL
jgi:hypothetical protein